MDMLVRVARAATPWFSWLPALLLALSLGACDGVVLTPEAWHHTTGPVQVMGVTLQAGEDVQLQVFNVTTSKWDVWANEKTLGFPVHTEGFTGYTFLFALDAKGLPTKYRGPSPVPSSPTYFGVKLRVKTLRADAQPAAVMGSYHEEPESGAGLLERYLETHKTADGVIQLVVH